VNGSLEERFIAVRERVADAAARVGREAREVSLLAVSKTFPADAVVEAARYEQVDFGENRVQEALAKMEVLTATPDVEPLRWHLIGPLQRNKVRKVIGKFECIHSVDSLKIAEALNRVAEEESLTQKILLQVRLGGEDSKSGFDEDELVASIEDLAACSSLHLSGLMTIPPPVSQPEEGRPYFSALRELRDKLSSRVNLPLKELSMGMSHDFEVAIEEGATFVRVGSALFGTRPKPK